MRSSLFLILALFLATPAWAQNAGIDRRFGADGIASFADAQAGGTQAIVSCAGANGALKVVTETDDSELVTFYLDARGGTAAAPTRLPFEQSMVFVSGRYAHGACMGDGRIVIARTVLRANDTNVQVLRLLSGGGLDTSFGSGGSVEIDMDGHAILADTEGVLGIHLEADGGILVSLELEHMANDWDAGLIRLAANGSVRFAGHYHALPGTSDTSRATAAGLGADGFVHLVGSGSVGNDFSWFRARIDATSGLPVSGETGSAGERVLTEGGRVLADGTLVVATVVNSLLPQDGVYRPRLLVLRPAGASHVDLPMPFAIAGSNATISINGTAGVIPTGDGRLLYAATLARMPDPLETRATYLAVVQLGANAAGDRVDPRFGSGGRSQFAWRGTPDCAGAPQPQHPQHMTNWRGRAVLTGRHAPGCAQPIGRALVARVLAAEDVFAADFD